MTYKLLHLANRGETNQIKTVNSQHTEISGYMSKLIFMIVAVCRLSVWK